MLLHADAGPVLRHADLKITILIGMNRFRHAEPDIKLQLARCMVLKLPVLTATAIHGHVCYVGECKRDAGKTFAPAQREFDSVPLNTAGGISRPGTGSVTVDCE